MTESASLQSRPLRAARAPDDYPIYRAALEWDLTDPIVIESKKDVKSSIRWRERVEPYNHQVGNLITFCRRLPVTLLADDVGLGKTISAGLIMSELIARARLSKTLIVCPKLLGPQWQDELQSKFDIKAKVVTGRELLTADPGEIGAVITTYQSARTYLEKLPKDRFEMLVLDEAHKLRNLYGTEKPPQVAVRFRKALEERRFPFVLMLTATPIHNRLWDLYSLVDLLTVARGHDNPFGSEGQFARKFIADDREKARHLKPEASDEFRSIVYGYMSRVRRGDAKLHFPDRQVQLHRVDPTPDELTLIKIVAGGIEKLNRLAQISILQALTSSPQALSAQLDTMERNRTIPEGFAPAVREHVRRMTTSAKLDGLGMLIERLKRENPDSWRLVIFTSRRETQTTIQLFLECHGLSVGIINGQSGSRNQDTIAKLRAEPPRYRVIVSTEAGSEGVNLQVANVLVNYDLPWNPMIVEQRIGRIQRLASKHASVGIFNITLRGTFEEYIVGRLMEKLQMSASAIGDIEALLEGSGVGGEEGDGFEEKIRQLVIAALKGADTEAATRMVVESIGEAKASLEREEKRIDEMLGGGDGKAYVGPRAPILPAQTRSLDPKAFTLGAFETLGATVSERSPGLYMVDDENGRDLIRFETEQGQTRSTLYAPGSPSFSTLVQRVVASGVHRVEDRDENPRARGEAIARSWAARFGGSVEGVEIDAARQRFEGTALVRARAVVAHDSYERLVEVRCEGAEAREQPFTKASLAPIPNVVERPEAIGIDPARVVEAAYRDPGLAEFSRFYIERGAHEVAAAGRDERKRKKMEDDFTPRFTFALAGAEGRLERELRAKVSYRIAGSEPLVSELAILPAAGMITAEPRFAGCAITKQSVPEVALAKCAVSGLAALKHLLGKSEHSGRIALPDHMVVCAQSGRRLIADEAEPSSVTGMLVGKHLLRTCMVTGKRAEEEHFGKCAFTNAEALASELRESELSGKLYRADQALQSSVSGKHGHRLEFVTCFETRQPVASGEAETCQVTGHKVRPGILGVCDETRKRVLPSELSPSAVSGRRVLKSLLTTSSVSGAAFLEKEGVRSAHGKFCAPIEARPCLWSGRSCHPDDLRKCALTGVEIHFEFATARGEPRLEPLKELLDGRVRNTDLQELWDQIAEREAKAIGKGRCRVEAAVLSPTGKHLAVSTEVRTMLGLRSRRAGFVFANQNKSIVGRIAEGKLDGAEWRALAG